MTRALKLFSAIGGSLAIACVLLVGWQMMPSDIDRSEPPGSPRYVHVLGPQCQHFSVRLVEPVSSPRVVAGALLVGDEGSGIIHIKKGEWKAFWVDAVPIEEWTIASPLEGYASRDLAPGNPPPAIARIDSTYVPPPRYVIWVYSAQARDDMIALGYEARYSILRAGGVELYGMKEAADVREYPDPILGTPNLQDVGSFANIYSRGEKFTLPGEHLSTIVADSNDIWIRLPLQ